MAYTAEQVVALKIQNRDAIDALAKRHQAEMKPLLDRDKTVDAWLLDHLVSTGVESVRTESGTFFKSTVLAVKVDKEQDGWRQMLDYIARRALARVADVMEQGGENCEEDAIRAFLTTPELELINQSVNKTAVASMMEQQDGKTPPGVSVQSIVNLNVRRS